MFMSLDTDILLAVLPHGVVLPSLSRFNIGIAPPKEKCTQFCLPFMITPMLLLCYTILPAHPLWIRKWQEAQLMLLASCRLGRMDYQLSQR